MEQRVDDVGFDHKKGNRGNSTALGIFMSILGES
jgi:hypothetical protein